MTLITLKLIKSHFARGGGVLVGRTSCLLETLSSDAQTHTVRFSMSLSFLWQGIVNKNYNTLIFEAHINFIHVGNSL